MSSELKSNFDAEVLIEEVQRRPIIWDLRLPEYLNKYRKAQMWTEVTAALYPNFALMEKTKKRQYIENVRKKWKGIRSSFSRELSNIKNHTGGPRKPYVYFENLQFLMPVVKASNTEDEGQTSPTDDDISMETVVKNELDWSLEGWPSVSTLKNQKLTPEEHQPSSERALVHLSPTNSALENHRRTGRPSLHHLTTTSTLEEPQLCTERSSAHDWATTGSALDEQSLGPNSGEAFDSDKYFLMSLLQELRRVPEDSKLQCKIAIMSSILKFVPPKPPHS